jgi:Flp pilus assembly pilin Flp
MKLPMTLKRGTSDLTPGQTMTEYVLILSAIAIVLIGGYNALGGTLSAMVRSIAAAL